MVLFLDLDTTNGIVDGIYDDDVDEWVTSRSGEALGFIAWAPGQPNNNDDHCLVIRRGYGFGVCDGRCGEMVDVAFCEVEMEGEETSYAEFDPMEV